MFLRYDRRKQRIADGSVQPTTPQRISRHEDDHVVVGGSDVKAPTSRTDNCPRKRQQQNSQQHAQHFVYSSSSTTLPPSSPPLNKKHSSPVLSFSSTFSSPLILMKHCIVRMNNHYRRRNVRDRIVLLLLIVLTCTVLLVQIFDLTDPTSINNDLRNLLSLSFLKRYLGMFPGATITASAKKRLYPPSMVYLDSHCDLSYLTNNNSSNLNTTTISSRARTGKSLSFRKLYNMYSTFRRRKRIPSDKVESKLQKRISKQSTKYQPMTTILKQIPYKILAPDYNGLLIPSMLLQYHENTLDQEEQDCNDKNISSFFQRTIHSIEDDDRLQVYREELLTYWDEEIFVSERYDFYDDLDHPQQCTRPQWTYSYHPNCLSFHEIVDPALSSTSNKNNDDGIVVPSVQYLAHGYYRDTWVFQDPNQLMERDEIYAVKQLRISMEQNIKSLEKIKVEALVQERLTGSPVITQIYGHCGTSTMVEMANEIQYQIVPDVEEYRMERGRIEQRVLDKLEKQGPHPFNNLTIIEKLNIAIAMAEGLAEEHGYRESVIVNDDIDPGQWLVTNDGRYILNDMNNAVFLRWNFQKQRYCKYFIGYGGNVRAPEEYVGDGSYVDESVDIWPMGNLIFSLLTGLYPYYSMTSNTRIQNVTMQGIRPYLHPEYKTRSYIERRLIEIMDKCHVLEPKDRVSIFEVLEHLYETRKHYHRKNYQ